MCIFMCVLFVGDGVNCRPKLNSKVGLGSDAGEISEALQE
jgi:hypothetical protein